MKLVLKRFVFFWVLFSVAAVNIDDKLDFGDSEAPSFRSHSLKKTSSFVPVKYTKTLVPVSTNKDSFDDIGVVCVSGGCNRTTVATTGNSEDSVQTDVVVHVETKVNLNQKGNKSADVLEDTPDIPVVVGYSGSKLDSTVEDGGVSTPQSIYVPDSVGSVSTYHQPSRTNNVRTYYNQPVGYTGGGSLLHRKTSYNPPVFAPVDSKFYPSGVHTIDNYSPIYADSLTSPEGNINRQYKVLSPVTVGFTNGNGYNVNNVKYMTNGSHIKLPYFEPSYHNHYYGENPPSQYTWYPKNANNYPSIDSKVGHREGPYQHTTTGQATTCVCQNGQVGQVAPVGQVSGLHWYPSVARTYNDDPGSQINDKLAPLNE